MLVFNKKNDKHYQVKWDFYPVLEIVSLHKCGDFWIADEFHTNVAFNSTELHEIANKLNELNANKAAMNDV